MSPLPLAQGIAKPERRIPIRPARVALVGPIQQENLALGYLASAARVTGHEAEIVAYSYRRDLDQTVNRILALKPDLVGLGIAFQNNIDDYLALLLELRARGFQGHLTCGGHVPTFCYEELLRDAPGLDSVVRHDGEETLVELLDALAEGRPPEGIAGLVWRGEAGIQQGPKRELSARLDDIAWPLRNPEPYSVGGIVVDFVLTARGCVGECNYCSIAAYTSEQGRKYRLRGPEKLAEELAASYHQRGARVFFVQDDLFVLPSEKKSIERCQRIQSALESHGVRDAVFWVKGRPESITPRVASALAEMGAIHCFLGIESADPTRLEYLGRSHRPEHNRSAIAALTGARIVPSFNFMLFDPDCTLEEIENTLDLADQFPELPWNLCRTEVYSGTSLRAQLEREGRLEGDYRSYGYRMADTRAELLFRILRVSLHERALAIESLLNRLISCSFARQLHQHFFPCSNTEALAARALEVGVEARQDTVNRVRDALAFAKTSEAQDPARLSRFAVNQALSVNAEDQERRRQIEELWRHLTLRGELIMSRRGVEPARCAHSGYQVASGS